MGLKLKLGSPVMKDNFFGRNKEIESALRLLTDHNSLMLAAPRRVGKTSFALKIEDVLEQRGWGTIYIDLEGVSNVDDFFLLLKERLLDLKCSNSKIHFGLFECKPYRCRKRKNKEPYIFYLHRCGQRYSKNNIKKFGR